MLLQSDIKGGSVPSVINTEDDPRSSSVDTDPGAIAIGQWADPNTLVLRGFSTKNEGADNEYSVK